MIYKRKSRHKVWPTDRTFDELWDLLGLLFATKNVFFVYDYWAWEPLRITITKRIIWTSVLTLGKRPRCDTSDPDLDLLTINVTSAPEDLWLALGDWSSTEEVILPSLCWVQGDLHCYSVSWSCRSSSAPTFRPTRRGSRRRWPGNYEENMD